MFKIGTVIKQAHCAYVNYDWSYGGNRYRYCHQGPMVAYKRIGTRTYFKVAK